MRYGAAVESALAILRAWYVGAAAGTLVACGHAAPATCEPLPPHVVQLGPSRCAHALRLPVPPAPPLVGDAAVDAIRLGEWQRKLELFASLDWAACDGGAP